MLWFSATCSFVLRKIFLSLVLAVASCTLAHAAVIAPLERAHRFGHPHALIPQPARRIPHSIRTSRLRHRKGLRVNEAHRAAIHHAALAATDRAPRNHVTAETASLVSPKSSADSRLGDDSADRIPSEIASEPAAGTRSRRLVMPPPLKGSLASLERQNDRSDEEGLERILNDADLNDRIAKHLLVAVPASPALTVNPDLPSNRRYCRPWTARFLSDLARAHAAQFRGPLEVSSAVRTVDYQKRLMHVNGNAAAAEGDIVSPHLTGATVDIAKHGLTLRELAWMRSRLSALQLAGKIDVEEEFQQACFHITVYKIYVPATPRHPRNTPLVTQLASRSQ